MSMCRCPWVILTDRSFLFATGVLRPVTDVDRGLVDLCPFQSLPPRGAPCTPVIIWSTMGNRRTGRPGYKAIEGNERRVHRRLKEGSSTEWTRSASGGKGTEYDSLCHRHVREVGAFQRDDEASVAAAAAASVNAVAASGSTRD